MYIDVDIGKSASTHLARRTHLYMHRYIYVYTYVYIDVDIDNGPDA